MVALKTINNNLHKFYKEKDCYINIEGKTVDAFNQAQALIFMAISGNKPKEKNVDTLNDLLDSYNHIPEFKALVDKGLAHLHETYKNETIDLGNKTAQGKDYFKQVQGQIRFGEMDFDALGTPKSFEDELKF